MFLTHYSLLRTLSISLIVNIVCFITILDVSPLDTYVVCVCVRICIYTSTVLDIRNIIRASISASVRASVSASVSTSVSASV